ncbi:MAG: hypothetical protein ACRCV9_07110 [Burkholderiaceae bacterium]
MTDENWRVPSIKRAFVATLFVALSAQADQQYPVHRLDCGTLRGEGVVRVIVSPELVLRVNVQCPSGVPT